MIGHSLRQELVSKRGEERVERWERLGGSHFYDCRDLFSSLYSILVVVVKLTRKESKRDAKFACD